MVLAVIMLPAIDWKSNVATIMGQSRLEIQSTRSHNVAGDRLEEQRCNNHGSI